MIVKGRKVMGGFAEGEALVSYEPVSFYGSIDPDTGFITEPSNRCLGECLTGKVFVFPYGKGSTVGSYVIYRMKKLGTAPVAIINGETDAIIATGCVISEIPLIDKLEVDPLNVIKNGMSVKVDADKGIVEISYTS
jgi:predicted aconitase with swiveling domain